MKNIKDKLYDSIVNENVKYEYERYVNEHLTEHNYYRIKHWIILIKLLFHYRVFKKNSSLLLYPEMELQNNIQKNTVSPIEYTSQNKKITQNSSHINKIPQDNVSPNTNNKKNVATSPKHSSQNVKVSQNLPYPEINKEESSCYNQLPPHQFVKKLLQYDTISFDVFDTLILRNISEMKSVYTLVGERLNYLSFQRIRQRAQREAREKNIRIFGSNEMSLEDIYEVIQRKTDIPVEVGVNAEMEVERQICYANPYMKRVFDILQSYKKRIVVVSDMYMSKNQINLILTSSGYYNISEIYVSSEYKCSKANGQLYNILLESEGINKKIIHVGDNPNSDIKMANANGIETARYTNVNTAGNKYRCDGQSQLVRAAYRGTVNNRLHCGMYKHSIPYEYGYVYGGLYIFGFANWIFNYCKLHNIDKVLFLARDGNIYQKAFSMICPNIPNEYVYWSRQANMKYAAKYQKEQYLLRNINHKLNKGISICSILDAAKIDFIKKDFKELKIDINEKLTDTNAELVEKIICKNWDKILDSYEQETLIAKQYFQQIIGNNKRIALVEVGWVGTSQDGLKKFIESEINSQCTVFCLSASNASSESADNIIQAMSPYYSSYLFSYMHNVSLTQFHRDKSGSKKTILFELFSQACQPSFKGFNINENGHISMEFDLAEVENYKKFNEIEQGSLDFCKDYFTNFKDFPILYNISGYDAYLPFRALTRKFDYAKENLGDITIAETVAVNEGEMNLLRNIL